MNKILINSTLSAAIFFEASQLSSAAGVEDYKSSWNQRRPLDEQYGTLKKMNEDGLLSGSLKLAFENTEKTCGLPKTKEEEAVFFKNGPSKPCNDALKNTHKEVFQVLIMTK